MAKTEWDAFVADVDSAIDGKLDMEVLNKLWGLADCTLYHIDHCSRVQIFMYVKRIGRLCTPCCEAAAAETESEGKDPVIESQCGKCVKVAVKHGPDYVPTRVFVVSSTKNRSCSGWLPSNKALCLRQVRNYFKVKGSPDMLHTLTKHFAPFVAATRDLF